MRLPPQEDRAGEREERLWIGREEGKETIATGTGSSALSRKRT